jgi:opacity protein-like surface antigen
MKSQLLETGLILILCVPAAASAQGRMPHAGASAVSGEVGVFLPRMAGMTIGPSLDGSYESYLDARDSLRVGAGWMYPKQNANSDAKTREVRLGVDIVHNWEGGAVHPFVGAGVGAYFLQPRVSGQNVGSSATKIGAVLLGGAEFFTSKVVSVKAEGRYHIVTKSGAYDPSGLELTIGVKRYF